jgi:regulator of nucleoside diphosphate kinase
MLSTSEELIEGDDRFRREDIELPPVQIMAEDYEILSDVVCASASATPGIELLWRELQRAEILQTAHPPSGLIHLNAMVRYTDLINRAYRRVHLISPGAPVKRRHGLSVASPVGAALIGLRVGDRFPWFSVGDGMRMLRVDRVDTDYRRLARREAADRRRLIDELLSAR